MSAGPDNQLRDIMTNIDMKTAIGDELTGLREVAADAMTTDPDTLTPASAARLLLAAEKCRVTLSKAVAKTKAAKPRPNKHGEDGK